MLNVAVAGASGYAGGEVLRWFERHPDARVGAVTAGGNAGSRLGAVHPHLFSLADRVLEETTVDTLRGHDAVVLALPHGHSAAVAEGLGDDVVVIDCGADFRLRDGSAWSTFYDTPYAGSWAYGLPELPLRGGVSGRDTLVGEKRIAVPGCYPTASTLALAPGFAAGVLEGDDVVIVAASGTSGAGKALKPNLLGAEVMGSMSPYGVGGVHRHTPEIEQNLAAAAGSPVTVSFTPTLAPMPRGILATCTARVRPGTTADTVREAWRTAYADEPFVHLLEPGSWPTTAHVIGSNHVEVQVVLDGRAGRVVAVAAVDNLAKGTAGAAVQCLNLAVGLPESTGLLGSGVAP
ncbi:N-acetyl-gamma-glutamyl-phosphate reductase [Knoellia subterranea]|uniref:N-acetyl-gamma-glutamyl-phosphate reductase n=1 Tax=Knoellia subterranea KCTC 19937 TaxID=1385521 RepID=A0A0A0JTJ1_9MICO|nr:N-acetyl-gamma-glutamyl-phosphate reductase [Knoellia subterranea]KGN38966.1 N-acetyl-gamma-glutamyl-phosphate reductase [Knoellia subterranea KCTC 19937]